MLGEIAETRRPAAYHRRVSAFGGMIHRRERPKVADSGRSGGLNGPLGIEGPRSTLSRHSVRRLRRSIPDYTGQAVERLLLVISG